MTPDQLSQYREKLRLGTIPDGDKTLEYAYRRGWNDGIEFAMNQLASIVGKETDKGEAA